MAHLLPHWTWPERVGKITPVHVFTSGDEAELFLNRRSLGRKKKGAYEYRLRWDEAVYEPGTIEVVAYKNGRPWAADSMRTTQPPAASGSGAAEPQPSSRPVRGSGLPGEVALRVRVQGVRGHRQANARASLRAAAHQKIA